MPTRMTPSQLRSKLRQIQSKQRQAINKYNQEVRKYNQQVRKVNHSIRTAVNSYNSQVRTYNSRVRANRHRLQHELNRLQSRTQIRFSSVRASSLSLSSAYQLLETRSSAVSSSTHLPEFLDLSERETANSLEVSNVLESEAENDTEVDTTTLTSSEISNELALISGDLDNRWKGALYSLNPENPDAARHFCTSAREIFVRILDVHAPNEEVLMSYPGCDKTDAGKPTRRWKIKFILSKSGLGSSEAVNFVEEDVDNVLKLFGVFNDGTHGRSGRFDLPPRNRTQS